jgi:hypothetical protein
MVSRILDQGTATALLLAIAFLPLMAPPTYAEAVEVEGFPTLAREAVTFWSDGTRIAGDLTYPKGMADETRLPVIVLCHGWGGRKSHLNTEIAPGFAKEGFIVLTFDYRGWGESDSRLVVLGEMPKPNADGTVTVKAQAIRQLVSPFDQQEDIDAAITFMQDQPGADKNRIGIWGSSFGGGHVIWRAAHDTRVKCVVAQVGGMGFNEQWVAGMKTRGVDVVQNNIDRVRGTLPPVPQGEDTIEGLRGTPHNEQFMKWDPRDSIQKITVPTLLIDASEEHYFDIRENSGYIYEQLKGKITIEYHVLDGITHYGVYTGDALKAVMRLEVPWFKKHL